MRAFILCFLLRATALASPPWVHYAPLHGSSSFVAAITQPYLTNAYFGNGTMTDAAYNDSLGNYGGVSFAAGTNGGAFLFSGTNWVFQSQTNRVLFGNLVNSGFTLSCWFNTRSSSGGSLCSLQTATNSTAGMRDFPIYMNNGGNIGWAYYVGGAVTPATYNDGKWHFVVATMSESHGGQIYMDGQLVASNGNGGGISNWAYYPAYWRIGNGDFAVWGLGASSAGWNGLVEDFRFYTVILDSSQVSTLFANGPDH